MQTILSAETSNRLITSNKVGIDLVREKVHHALLQSESFLSNNDTITAVKGRDICKESFFVLTSASIDEKEKLGFCPILLIVWKIECNQFHLKVFNRLYGEIGPSIKNSRSN